VEKTVYTCDRCHEVSGEDLAEWYELVPREEGSDKQPRTLCPECVEAFLESPVAAEDGITPAEAKALHARAVELAAEARRQAREQEKRRLARDEAEGHERLAADARDQAAEGHGQPDARQQAEAREAEGRQHPGTGHRS
jgi:hypothetical protein